MKTKEVLLCFTGCVLLVVLGACYWITGQDDTSGATESESFPVINVQEVVIQTPKVAVETPVVVEEFAEVIPAAEFWSSCRVTAYCPCEKCCGKWALNRPVDPVTGKQIVTGSAGIELQSFHSCASSLPLGTKIYIPEIDLHLVVEDRAAKWIDEKYDGHYIDIYIDDHETCYDYIIGKPEYMDVYIEEVA